MRPLVSVIIPAFNAAKTIERALDSVVAQAYPELETIVIDDCSRDSTAQVVDSYKGAQIRLLRLSRNAGECGAMNAGIAVAKGKYVAFLDADDEWRPTKLAKQVEALERNPRASFATCAHEVLRPNGDSAGVHGAPPDDFNYEQPWRDLLVGNFIAKPSVVCRASSLAQAGPFDVALRVAGDQDMWIRLAKVGALEFVPEALTTVYRTPNSLMSVYAGREAEFVIPMIERHLAEQRSLLSKSECQRILGERYASVGRDLCHGGRYLGGARYILRGMMTGAKIRENVWFVIMVSPFVKVVRSLLASLERQAKRFASFATRSP